MNTWELYDNVVKIYRNHKKSTNCTINFQGGAITSWNILSLEQLFMKDESKFDNINPIQGGIHVLFPNFNMDQINMPNNGFARFCRWVNPKEPYVINNNIAVEVELKKNEVMKGLTWDHPFHLNLKIILGQSTLSSIVKVYNPHPENKISFNLILETFLRLRSIGQCEIYGLDDCDYINKVKCDMGVDRKTPLVITGKIDRIYRDAKDKIFIHDLSERRKIKLTKQNFPDIFVMNPWFGDYNGMICVAPGFISRNFVLAPKTWFQAGQKLEILPL